MLTKIRSLLTQPAIVSSAIVTAVLFVVQYAGVFEQQEVQVFDRMMQIRSNEEPDPRLLVVGFTEKDTKLGYPLPNELFVKVFEKLEQYQPRAIGFDFVRDQASSNDEIGQRDYAKLLQHLQNSDIIVPVCNDGDSNKSNNLNNSQEFAPPPGVEPKQVGFSNLQQDSDGAIRRNLLLVDVAPSSKCTAAESLGLQLALKYLEVGGIQPEVTPNNQLKIRDVVFKRLNNYSGGYQNIDAESGYQILFNYPSQKIAAEVSITDVLTDKVSPDLIKDKVILIGTTAPLLKDIFKTPLDYSANTPGVVIHANSVSQILSAVLNKKPLFWFLPEWGEVIWLWGWSLVGGLVVWKIRHPVRLAIAGSASGVTLVAASFFIFTQAGWFPVVSPLLGLLLTGGSVLAYCAYQSQQEQEKILQQVEEQQDAIAQLQALLRQPGNNTNKTEIIVPLGAEMPLNTVLNNRYKLIKNLAIGGFGGTYLAEDIQRPGNPINVVKQLRPSREDTQFLQIARRLFKTEGEILELLGKHDRIPQLFACFEENQQFFIVQEFIKGCSLDKEIIPGKNFSESEVIQILKDVLEVLVFVHSHRVIHRDIKPGNLIRREQDGRIVLIDFGAVKQIQPQQPENLTIGIGTVGYAPSEQIAGFPKLNSDIYALGITGIQALTGIDPREFQRNPDTSKIEFKSSPDIPALHWREIAATSQKLADILDQMTDFDFKQRYQSAAEVLQQLEKLN
ncbi:MAG: CHASE2 domain-containing serine/threonine-protein kinase [Nostocales cyanobacterium 94392]|nr:CHASE2 domain-containing serine/threonine-protein kinase [Nostocales cyanobacterium 94392]